MPSASDRTSDVAGTLEFQLQRAFANSHTADPAAVRQILRSYVNALKREGVAVERVIIRVKEIASRSGLGRRTRPQLTPREIIEAPAEPLRIDDLLADSIRWCIEVYYSDVPPKRLSARPQAADGRGRSPGKLLRDGG